MARRKRGNNAKPKKITKKKQRKIALATKRRSLREWSSRGDACCAMCGERDHVKLNSDGSIKRIKSGRCQGKPVVVRMNNHHILKKETYPEYQYMDINRLTLCPKHHKHYRFSAHENPLFFVLWLKANRPEQYAWAKAHMGTDPLLSRDNNGEH